MRYARSVALVVSCAALALSVGAVSVSAAGCPESDLRSKKAEKCAAKYSAALSACVRAGVPAAVCDTSAAERACRGLSPQCPVQRQAERIVETLYGPEPRTGTPLRCAAHAGKRGLATRCARKYASEVDRCLRHGTVECAHTKSASVCRGLPAECDVRAETEALARARRANAGTPDACLDTMLREGSEALVRAYKTRRSGKTARLVDAMSTCVDRIRRDCAAPPVLSGACAGATTLDEAAACTCAFGCSPVTSDDLSARGLGSWHAPLRHAGALGSPGVESLSLCEGVSGPVVSAVLRPSDATAGDDPLLLLSIEDLRAGFLSRRAADGSTHLFNESGGLRFDADGRVSALAPAAADVVSDVSPTVGGALACADFWPYLACSIGEAIVTSPGCTGVVLTCIGAFKPAWSLVAGCVGFVGGSDCAADLAQVIALPPSGVCGSPTSDCTRGSFCSARDECSFGSCEPVAPTNVGMECTGRNELSGGCCYPQCDGGGRRVNRLACTSVGYCDPTTSTYCEADEECTGDEGFASCTPRCGNLRCDAGEDCDAGGDAPSCLPGCTFPRCGNGVQDDGEACDPGTGRDTPSACRATGFANCFSPFMTCQPDCTCLDDTSTTTSTTVRTSTTTTSSLPGGGGDGDTWGDPHLVTFDGLAYDLQAVGEFVLVRSGNAGLEIQTRTAPYQGSRVVSVNTAVAMNVVGDRVAVYLQPRRILVNGAVLEDGPSIALPHGGHLEVDGAIVRVSWPDGSTVRASTRGSYLDVKVLLASSHANDVEGLLGDFDGSSANDLVIRGTDSALGAILDYDRLYGDFAESWRLTQGESLFDYADGTSTATYTDRSFPRSVVTADSLDAAARAAAAAACTAAGITDPVLFAACVLDVALTGDASFAEATTSVGAPSQGVLLDDEGPAWRRHRYTRGLTSRYPFAASPNLGQPSIAWTDDTLRNATVLTADLNGDDVLDVVASNGSTIRAFDGQGGTLWSLMATTALTYVGDVDGDGAPELCATRRNASNHLLVDVYEANGSFAKTIDRGAAGYDSSMTVLDHVGDHLVVSYDAGYSLSPRGVGLLRYSTAVAEGFIATGGSRWGTTAIGDVDGDGRLDVAPSWGTPHNGASTNGTTDGDLYGTLVVADIGAAPPTLSFAFRKVVTAWNPATNPNGSLSTMMPDLDRDGRSELLYLEGHDPTYYRGQEQAYAVDAAGQLLARWPGGGQNGNGLLGAVIEDQNADGVQDLVFSSRAAGATVFVVDGAALTTIRSRAGAGNVLGVADVNGDGRDDVIVHQASTQRLELLDAETLAVTGTVVVGGLSLSDRNAVSPFAISDVTGDGRLELIVGGASGVRVVGLQ